VYALQRLQLWLPLNPQARGNVTPDSAFNTAVNSEGTPEMDAAALQRPDSKQQSLPFRKTMGLDGFARHLRC